MEIRRMETITRVLKDLLDSPTRLTQQQHRNVLNAFVWIEDDLKNKKKEEENK